MCLESLNLRETEKEMLVWGQDVNVWPILPPLPSYGRGRELPGPRYGSLIHGQHINDFVLTGKLHISFVSLCPCVYPNCYHLC